MFYGIRFAGMREKKLTSLEHFLIIFLIVYLAYIILYSRLQDLKLSKQIARIADRAFSKFVVIDLKLQGVYTCTGLVSPTDGTWTWNHHDGLFELYPPM